MEQILCVLGPTASGKTELAVRLARQYHGEVISCDSMQLYRRMDIGTAKPTREEMAEIPHHMIDVAEPGEEFSVSRYVTMADPILQDILSRGKTAVIAGGTGLYVDSLLLGRTFAPYPQTGRRQALEALDTDTLVAMLREADPDSARRLHPSDRKRIIRALEVFQETGKTITTHNEESKRIPPKYRASKLALTFADRQKLYDRIDRRVQLMLENGLVAETGALLSSGVCTTAMQAIGYKELLNYLAGRESLEEAAARIAQESRRYAKRQLTWFRRDPEITWFPRESDGDMDDIFTRVCQFLSETDKSL